MASSVLRRYLPQRASLRRSFPPHLPSAAAGAFRRSFQSGDRETLDEFDERMFGTKDTDEGSVYAKLDRVGNPSRRYGIGSGSSVGGFSGFGDRSGSGSSVGGFSGFGDRSGSGSSVGGFSGFGDRSGSGSSVGGFPGVSDRSSSGSAMRDFPGFSDRNGSGSAMGGLGGFSDNSSSWSSRSYDSWNDGINQELVNVARNVQMDDDDDDDDGNEVEQDDFEFRSDVRFRRGATYSVRDLDLRRPAVAKNPPRQQFKTTTAEVLRKADFRNVRFLSHFLTEAGIIIKRSQVTTTTHLIPNIITIEAYAKSDGAVLVNLLNQPKMLMETDCLELQYLWRTKHINRLTILPVLNEIQIGRCMVFELDHVKREANIVAHDLAKLASVSCLERT